MPKNLKVGLVISRTDKYGAEGEEAQQTLEILLGDLNAKGGIHGRNVELLTIDDEGDPQSARSAMQWLAIREGVFAVIGPRNSATIQATQRCSDEAEILQISNGANYNSLIETKLRYFFNTGPREDQRLRTAVETMDAFGVKRLALLYNSTNYGLIVNTQLKHIFQSTGNIEIVMCEDMANYCNHYSFLNNKIRQSYPDIVYYHGQYDELRQLIGHSQYEWFNFNFMLGYGISDQDNIKTFNKLLSINLPYPIEYDSESSKQFLKSYRNQYGNVPESVYSMFAGDAFLAAMEAVRQTDSASPGILAEFLRNGSTKIQGLTGNVSFGEMGDRVENLFKAYGVIYNRTFRSVGEAGYRIPSLEENSSPFEPAPISIRERESAEPLMPADQPDATPLPPGHEPEKPEKKPEWMKDEKPNVDPLPPGHEPEKPEKKPEWMKERTKGGVPVEVANDDSTDTNTDTKTDTGSDTETDTNKDKQGESEKDDVLRDPFKRLEGEPKPEEPTKPVKPVQPTEPVQPAEPTDPMKPADPIRPGEKTEPNTCEKLKRISQEAFKKQPNNCSGTVAEVADNYGHPELKGKLANEQVDYMEKNWKPVDSKTAQELANKGELVVAGLENSGHTAVVTPGEGEAKHGKFYPNVTGGGGDAGRSNGQRTAGDTWNTKIREKVKYYTPK